MADTDIRCHKACVYSGCSVMCNNMCEKKLQHWLPAAADACLGQCDCMRAGRVAVSGAKAVRLNIISPRVLTGDHTQRCTDTCECWRTHVDARQRRALCVHVHACVHYGWRTDGADARRRTSTQDTACAKLYATYRCCQWAQLRCHGVARGRSQDFTLVATEAERRSIFSQKSWQPFIAVVCKNFTVLNKAGPMSQQSQFFP